MPRSVWRGLVSFWRQLKRVLCDYPQFNLREFWVQVFSIHLPMPRFGSFTERWLANIGAPSGWARK